MSWVATGVIFSMVSAGYGASEGHKAKTKQKHVKKRSTARASELAAQASAETDAASVASKKEKRKRAQGYARNINLFGGSVEMSKLADSAVKTLTGQ